MYVRRGFGGLTPPVSGSAPISSLFGPRAAPLAGASTNHQGIDYAVPVGTPVLAAGSGTVVFAGVQSGFGNTVVVDMGNGVTTLYGHLSSINVTPGQTVADGQQVALSGDSGLSTGPHLHFGVYQNGVAVDPTTQLGADIADGTPADSSGSGFAVVASDASSVFDGSLSLSDALAGADPALLWGGAALAIGLGWALLA